MKKNVFQKILLVLYGCAFVYFSIIHVPFKTNHQNEIKYDTLFSHSSNLEVSRLVVIIVILSILTSILWLLLDNIDYTHKSQRLPKKAFRIGTYSFVVVLLLVAAIFSINKFQTKKEVPKIVLDAFKTTDTTSIVVDTARHVNIPSYEEVMKCNEEQALEDFESYMKFYYPDWRIYGKPIVKQMFGCVFRIQFITINPHIRYEREVMIAEIAIDPNLDTYRFNTLRGTLY